MSTQIEFKEKQLLRVTNVSGCYTINRVTEKAILIECDNGNWIDNGRFIPMWIPKSILDYVGYNSNTQNSQFGIHVVNLPEWFINNNSKKW